MKDPVAWYDANANIVAPRYEGVAATSVHGWIEDLLPEAPATAMDVGAGSGRDAAWLASMGLDVIAAEPSRSMREAGADLHPDATFRWVEDRLPSLAVVTRSGLTFDLIILNAVWMHLPENERPRAFRKVINLLKPSGLLIISLRMGQEDRERGFHPVSAEEIESLARDHGAFVARQAESGDLYGRDDVRWIRMAVRLPDDGSGALPHLRMSF